MIKCSFVMKDNNEFSVMKTQEEVNNILQNDSSLYFSVKIVDEYIFVDRQFSQEEFENIVAPHMIRICANSNKNK